MFRVPTQIGTYEATLEIIFEQSDFYSNLSGNKLTLKFIIKTI